MTVLVVDNGSPYVKDITLCLNNLGQDYDLKKYDEEFFLSNYQKIILSGRRKNKKEINSINSKKYLNFLIFYFTKKQSVLVIKNSKKVSV